MAACAVHGVLQARLRTTGAQDSIPQYVSLSCARASAAAHQCNKMLVKFSERASKSSFLDAYVSNKFSSSPCPECSGSSSRSRKVVCMAHPRRVKMVQQQIKRELADMLLHDKVLQSAVIPESALGADMYLSSVATVSDVEISRDLSVAKVFISVYGDEREQEIAMEGLKGKTKYVRMGLGKRMSLRMTPEVRFIKDDSLERGSRVLEILGKLKEERERKERGETEPSEVEVEEEAEASDVEEDEEDDAVSPRSKRRANRKPSASRSNRGADVKDEIDWDDDDFRDLDFSEDENIIFIK